MDFLKRIFGGSIKLTPKLETGEKDGAAKYVVVMNTTSFPYRLYLQSECSSLDTIAKISAQAWNRLVAHAAHFPEKTAKNLAVQAMKSGAKDCMFEAIPFTLGADINAKLNDGATALRFASKKDHKEVMELLIRAGAK
jgi:ankyrin repeat protein